MIQSRPTCNLPFPRKSGEMSCLDARRKEEGGKKESTALKEKGFLLLPSFLKNEPSSSFPFLGRRCHSPRKEEEEEEGEEASLPPSSLPSSWVDSAAPSFLPFLEAHERTHPSRNRASPSPPSSSPVLYILLLVPPTLTL